MIPSVAHLVWLGSRFCWVNALAVVSAARGGRFERVVLHTDSDLSGTAHWSALSRLPGFEARPLVLEDVARAAAVPLPRLSALLARLPSPAARSDLLRAAILAGRGGVYLDADTVTLAPLDDLRAGGGAFCGEERVCFPGWSQSRPGPAGQTRAWALTALRFLLRLLPRGFVAFRQVEPLYALQVNNAVLGAEAGHPLLHAYLEAMLSMAPEQAARPYAIGPDLLAAVLARQRSSGVRVLPPSWFYPMPPEISEHWWARSADPRADLARILHGTRVVHWYASVRNRRRAARVDPAYVRAHQGRQLFSALAARFLGDFES